MNMNMGMGVGVAVILEITSTFHHSLLAFS